MASDPQATKSRKLVEAPVAGPEHDAWRREMAPQRTIARIGALIWTIVFRPTWKTFPIACVGIAAIAAAVAPASMPVIGWLLRFDWNEIFANPSSMAGFARAGGVCVAVGTYAFGIVPVELMRPRLRRYPPMLTYALAIGGAMLGASAGLALAHSGLLGELLGGPHAMRMTPPRGRMSALSFVVAASAAGFAMLLRTIFTEAENRERVLSEAAALAKAHALQSQINPHFFFNTLTTISALAELDSRAAKQLVGRLADLFRYTLACSKFEMVTLSAELEFVANYLSIEQTRFGRRLHFELPAPSSGSDVLVPGLTLQPIVENAIRHGIAKRREGGFVRVSIERPEPHTCRVLVVNQVPVEEDDPQPHPDGVFRPGHALANTRDRLDIAFRGSARLDFIRDSDEWVTVSLTVPVQGVTR